MDRYVQNGTGGNAEKGGRTAYSYIRFSCRLQERGASLARQLEYSEAYAKKHSLRLDDTLDLKDLGVSAFRGKNARTGALAGFLAAINSGKVAKGSVLLIENLDRLSRDELTVSVSLFLQIINAGIDIVSIMDDRVYTRQSLDMTSLIISIMVLSRGHEESATKSKRVRDAYLRKVVKAREAGGRFRITRMGPAWLKPNDQGGWDIIEEKAQVVRDIFRYYDEGLGKWRIAQKLNDNGIPPFRGGRLWTPRYVAALLTSPAVIGHFRPGHWTGGIHRYKEGEDIAGYFPAVVDGALFGRCYLKIKGRYKMTARPGRIHLLTGLVHCGHSGERAIVWGTSKRERRVTGENKLYRYYYFIAGTALLRTSVDYKSWNIEYLETNFLLFCLSVDWEKIAASNQQDQRIDWTARRQGLEKQDKELTREIGNLYSLVAQGRFASAAAEIEKREQQQTELRAKVEQLLAEEQREQETTRALCQGAPDVALMRQVLTGGGDKDTRLRLRAEIQRRVERIEIYPNGFDLTSKIERDLGVPLKDGKVQCYRVTFRNGVVRWVVPKGVKQTDVELVIGENSPTCDSAPPLKLDLPTSTKANKCPRQPSTTNSTNGRNYGARY